MQILIDLHGGYKGITPNNEVERNEFNIAITSSLLLLLMEKGYEIRGDFDMFYFDEAQKEGVIIESGVKEVHPDISFTRELYEKGAKMMVVFPKEKLVAFSEVYFLAIYFCHYRRVRPLSPFMALTHPSLFTRGEHVKRLYTLYKRELVRFNGINAEAQPTLLNDNRVHSSGFAFPAYFEDAFKEIMEEEEEENEDIEIVGVLIDPSEAEELFRICKEAGVDTISPKVIKNSSHACFGLCPKGMGLLGPSILFRQKKILRGLEEVREYIYSAPFQKEVRLYRYKKGDRFA